MSIENLVKRIQDIMRQDAGVDGDAQRISQLVWLLFLKVYDAKEEEWEFMDDNYESIIPEELKWRSWAPDNKDGKALTGGALLDFVNNQLFPTLKDLEVDEYTPQRAAIVKTIFEDAYNYMRDGVLLRQVINVLNEVDFNDYQERHAFNDVYETFLKSLQSAGSSGEFYTSRVLTEFIIEMLDPKIGEVVADYAAGTGGFLTSALEHLRLQEETPEDRETINKSIIGIEKKGLPYMLAMTNLILHDIDEPGIKRGNSLADNVREVSDKNKVDVFAMNPPYGGVEGPGIQANFPSDMQTKETADLFIAMMMYHLKKNGRAGVILPDGFLFGTEGAKVNIKKKLLREFNLHTIVRLPAGVFAPYTPIKTNILFFENKGTTGKIDLYEIPLPDGLKNGFTKTRPFMEKHIEGAREWYLHRENGDENAYSLTIEEIEKRNFNIDIRNPLNIKDEEVFTLDELMANLKEKALEIESLLGELSSVLKGDN
ncbi:N-6 DNA methylase [Aerococcus urinaeequi]|uniref:class I SAM-dependent DNA methyltransferase n=1 Tax=Aerococcus urinaeequi TaxID=51665 RepID=UPI003B4E5DC1